MAFIWNDDPVEVLQLSNNNTIQVAAVDIQALVMSADNKSIPNGLLEQLSAQLNGQAPDQELVCHSGVDLPLRGDPVLQGAVRGHVVDVSGDKEHFTVRVSVPSGVAFQAGKEVRFGGIRVAMVEAVRPWVYRIGGGDAEKLRQDLPEYGEFINLVVRSASWMPKVVNEVTDPETEIDIKRLKLVDKMIILNWAMPREVRPAGTFPQEPAAGVAAAPDMQVVQPEPSGGIRPETSVGEVAVQPLG